MRAGDRKQGIYKAWPYCRVCQYRFRDLHGSRKPSIIDHYVLSTRYTDCISGLESEDGG